MKFQTSLLRKLFSQTSHWKFLLPVCTNICVFTLLFWVKLLSHILHLNCFALNVWVIKWVFKLPFLVKYFPQTWHWNSFFPLCTNMCCVKLPIWVNHFSQTSHLYDLSPEWTLLCMSRLYFRLNDFLQPSQAKHFVAKVHLLLSSSVVLMSRVRSPYLPHFLFFCWNSGELITLLF